MRKISVFKIKNKSLFIKKLVLWLNRSNVFMFCNSNGNKKEKNYGKYDIIAGVNCISEIKSNRNSFKKLKKYYHFNNDWVMGSLCYDLKNEIEKLNSRNNNVIPCDNIYFFQPQLIFIINNSKLELHHFDDINFKKIINDILNTKIKKNIYKNTVVLKGRETKKEYLNKIKNIKNHIQQGDIYEMNYCQEFYSANTIIDPVETYFSLNQKSLAPFSCFFKKGDNYLISASPERYIKGDKEDVISQPIKGTSKRSSLYREDNILRDTLLKSQKEISENIMTVDLVRNDLARFAIRGTVKVSELCKVYSFKQVHQLISTIKCKLDFDKDWIDVLRLSFPMGSMTGTPKIKSMELIEKFENFRRGIFSGSVGYVNPHSDFDFNVIIRSIIYNKKLKHISVPVGGAITIKSNPEEEYEECMIKAKAMFNSLYTI